MASLIDPAKFGLSQGDLVVAQVSAFNAKGQGNFSGTNIIGALVEELPSAPVNGPRTGPLTDEQKMDIEWDFLIGES